MKTTTYTYRLYQFENGLGETVWQAKEPFIFGWWIWVGETAYSDDPLQWSTRDAAMKGLREHAQNQLDKAAKGDRDAKRAQLKLIVIEPVKIDL